MLLSLCREPITPGRASGQGKKEYPYNIWGSLQYNGNTKWNCKTGLLWAHRAQGAEWKAKENGGYKKPREFIGAITVESEPRLPPDAGDSEMTGNQREDRLFQIFQEELGKYYPGTIRRNLIARNTLPHSFLKFLRPDLRRRLPSETGFNSSSFLISNMQTAHRC